MTIEKFEGGHESWNELIGSLPGAHILQSWEWGEIKAAYGWKPLPHIWREQGEVSAAALLLQRSVPIQGFSARLRILYVPKGPLLNWSDLPLRRAVLDDLAGLARRQGAIFIKIDPDVRQGSGIPGSPGAHEEPLGIEVGADLRSRGWQFSAEQVQFRNTVLIDLSATEEELLASMKPKMRYNIRLAERKGVTIRPAISAELGDLYRMYAETSVRDGFVIREEAYYRKNWETFLDTGKADILVAEVGAGLVAAVVVFHFACKAWYLYGMSTGSHRDKMPNHLLQWKAMLRAKDAGCHIYDLWGAPDKFDEQDPLWGVYRFKEGFGGKVVRHVGAWDYAARPLLYRLYTQSLPRLLSLLRFRRIKRTKSMIED